jgi:beta-N-acetylhexosaminidase
MPARLHDRIGQMMMVGFRGLTPLEAQPTMRHIADGAIGAVILYDLDFDGSPRNIQSRDQLRDLTTALKAAGEIPVLVSLDAEGGFYHRLREKYGFAPAKSAAEMGERNDPAFTRATAGIIASELADVGIDLNLAPVVDPMNPVNLEVGARHRSFSSDPAVVAVHAREFILAHHERGVLTAPKHFPGMGGIVRWDESALRELIDDWSEDELRPYWALIGEGLLHDAVMVSRMITPELDSELPACLSPRVVDGLLRRQIGFDGVVISDALENAAIWEAYGLARGTILAINAGVDMLLLCNINPVVAYSDERGPEVVQIVLDAIARGEIAESRINEACGRVLALKSRLLA